MNKTLSLWTKNLNKTLHLDLTQMQDSIMQLQQMMVEEVGSGMEMYQNTTLDMAVDNTTLITLSGNNDEPNNVTEMSAQVRPENMEGKWSDIIEGKVISYITLFLSSTGLLTSFVLL